MVIPLSANCWRTYETDRRPFSRRPEVGPTYQRYIPDARRRITLALFDQRYAPSAIHARHLGVELEIVATLLPTVRKNEWEIAKERWLCKIRNVHHHATGDSELPPGIDVHSVGGDTRRVNVGRPFERGKKARVCAIGNVVNLHRRRARRSYSATIIARDQEAAGATVEHVQRFAGPGRCRGHEACDYLGLGRIAEIDDSQAGAIYIRAVNIGAATRSLDKPRTAAIPWVDLCDDIYAAEVWRLAATALHVCQRSLALHARFWSVACTADCGCPYRWRL